MIDAVTVRLEDHARRLHDLESARPAVVANEVANLHRDIGDLREEVRSLRRALYTVALTVAGGAITFAFTAFQLWGGTP